jgi:hypothetical protein
MRVLDSDCFAVYIYDDEHPPPHCHLIFSDGEEVVVGLPFLNVWYGKSIRRKVRQYLEENIDLLVDIWEIKHPQRN